MPPRALRRRRVGSGTVRMEAWDGGRHLSCLNGQAGRLLCKPELVWELEGREICQRNTSICQIASLAPWEPGPTRQRAVSL